MHFSSGVDKLGVDTGEAGHHTATAGHPHTYTFE